MHLPGCHQCGRNDGLSRTIYYSVGAPGINNVESCWVCEECRESHEVALKLTQRFRQRGAEA